MKNKYYDVGTFMYIHNHKHGAEILAACIIGGSALAGAAISSGGDDSSKSGSKGSNSNSLLSSGIIAGGNLASSIVAAEAQNDANETNVELAREQREFQEKLFHEGNEFNAEQAEIARNFNAQESALTRNFQADMLRENMRWYEKYNSAQEQVRRHMAAGLNPASLAGKLDYSGSFGVPSGSAASATPASAAAAPQVAGATVQPVNPMAGVISNAIRDMATYEQSKKTSQETFGLMTENKFKELTIKKGLDLTDSEIEKNYEQANLFISESDLTTKKIDEVGAIVRNLNSNTEKTDVETQIDNQRKIYASDLFKYQVKELEEKYKYSKGLADTIVKLTYAKIASYQGQAAASFANAEYLSAYSKLAPYEQAVLDNTSQVLDTQNRRDKYNFFLDQQFGWKERFWKNESTKESVGRQQYENTNTYRVIQGVKDVAVGVGGAAGAAYGTYKGAKYLKTRRGKGNPINAVTYSTSVTPY